MFSIIETVATTILLLLLMIFVIHLLRGDALEWLVSKFQVGGLSEGVGRIDKPTNSPPPVSSPPSGVPA